LKNDLKVIFLSYYLKTLLVEPLAKVEQIAKKKPSETKPEKPRSGRGPQLAKVP
jgi:hypothetical protein